MQATLGHLVEWSAQNYPDKTALVYTYADKAQRWTYRQLDEAINRFAQALQGLGVGKGDVISTFLYNTSEFVISLFASARIGAIFNPINYRLSAHELHYILDDVQSKVLLYGQMGSEVVEQARGLGVQVDHYIYVDQEKPSYALDFYSLLEGQSPSKPQIIISEDDPCILMYTSGTTGQPKGVLHTHRSKIQHNFMMMQCMGITQEDVGLAAAPLNHTAELHTMFLARVHVGATNVLLHHFESKAVLRTIAEEKVTLMFAAPTMINMLLHDEQLTDYDLSSLRLVEYGGASMAPALIHSFHKKVGADLVQIYGTTEMGPCMSVLYAHEQLSKAGSAGSTPTTGTATTGTAESSKTETNSGEPSRKEIIFGTSAGPYADQIKLGIKPILEEQGYSISVIEFGDYIQPNLALAEGSINVNVFQHIIYLEAFAKEHDLDLTASIQVPTAPIGLYSEKYQSLTDLQPGMKITLPNDATNQAHALIMLEQFGAIELKKEINPLQASEKDIADNKYNLQLIPLEAAQLPRSLADADFAFVNGNFAIASGLKLEEAVALEQTPDEYMNLVAFRTEDFNAQFAQDILAAYQSEQFKQLIEQEFKGFVKPDYLK